MNWILASFLMFAASNVYYLIIKKATILNIDKKVYMLCNYAIPFIIFSAVIFFTKLPLWIGWKNLGILLIFSLIPNYVGSIVSYIAIKNAPNSGYSLVIQKSYAVFTSIVAVFLFSSELSVLKFIAILIIVVGGALITLGKIEKKGEASPKWILYSFIAFFCFGLIALSGKYFGTQKIDPSVYLFWISFTTGLVSGIDLLINKKKVEFKASPKMFMYLFLIGFSVTFFYLFKQISQITAPNVGYSNAINASSNAFYTLLVAFLFKDHISSKKILGVIAVTVGVILIVI